MDVQYYDETSAVIPIKSAHFSGTRKMSIAWFDAHVGAYVLYRVQDQRTDDALWGTTTSLATVMAWVNVGHVVPTKASGSDGDYVVKP